MTMPLDTAIPLGFRFPQIDSDMDKRAKALTLSGLIEQQRMRQMQMEQQAKLRQALQANPGNLEKAMEAAIAAGDLDGAAKLAPLLKEQRQARLMSRVGGGNLEDPNVWRKAAFAGVAGAAPEAERLQARRDAQQQLELMRGTTGIKDATQYAPDEASALEMVKAASASGKPMTVGVGEAPTGIFADLINSEFKPISNQARMLQKRLNGMKPEMLNAETLKFFQNAQQSLAASEAKMQQQVDMRSQFPQPVQVIYEPTGNGKYRARDARTRSVLSEDALPPGAVISPDLKGAAAAATEAGKLGAKNSAELYESATASNDVIKKTDILLNHLKNSDAITGLGADIFKNIERAKVLLLNREKAGIKVSDTELLDIMMGSEVFPMIKSLGIGARGLDTPAEREFLRQVMTGTVSLNKATLIRMAEMRKQIAQREIQKWNDRVDEGSLDNFFKHSQIPKKKFGSSGALPQSAPDAGWTAEKERRFQELKRKQSGPQ